jgi:hypothetical protein
MYLIGPRARFVRCPVPACLGTTVVPQFGHKFDGLSKIMTRETSRCRLPSTQIT